MNSFVLKGHICKSRDKDHIEIVENGYLVVENGLCAGVFSALPERYAALTLTDYGDRLILPGMSDLHIHAPQFAFRGLGMDMELLPWLNAYAFKEEKKYADPVYASRAYGQFAAHIRRSYTTRAAVFGTIHAESTELLMKLMDEAGLHGYVGKVNMDRNSPEYLCETSSARALEATERWICRTKEKFSGVKPIITPRFIPACSDELMHGLRKLVEKYDLPVQSHLSESLGEIELVKKLCPSAKFYGDAYADFGLFGGDHPCVMAHCVHSSEEEIELMKKNGVYVAHSPESNINLSSGVAPISKYLELGLNVGLATDIAGGSHESILRAMMHAIQSSKLRQRLMDERVKPLSFERAFYIATAGGGSFFGKVGSFDAGYELDALVVDDASLVSPLELSVRDRLERAIYLADERNLYAKYVAGKRLF